MGGGGGNNNTRVLMRGGGKFLLQLFVQIQLGRNTMKNMTPKICQRGGCGEISSPLRRR